MAIMPSATAEELLRTYLDRFSAGDPDGMVALFDEQSLVEIPLFEERAYGTGAIRAALQDAIESVSDVQINLNTVIGSEHLAMAEADLTAMGRNGAPDLNFSFGLVVEARDGRIARLSEYFDTDPILPLGN